MPIRPLHALVLLTLTGGLCHAADADPAEDGFVASFGVERSASILSGGISAKPEVSPLLGLDYRSGRFFASTNLGVGYDFWKTEALTAFAALGYQPGRKASKAGDRDDNQRLVGMGKIRSSAALVAGVTGEPLGELVQLTAALRKSARSEQGLAALFGASVNFPVWGPVSGFAGLDVLYGDRKHVQTFFGVTPAQAASSGNPVFRPKAGFIGTSFSLGLNWDIDPRWSATASVGREQLMGDAKKSPLFTRKSDTTVSATVSYRF